MISLIGISILTYQWVALYFSSKNNANNVLEIVLFHQKYQFYWRSISLSSYSKVVIFLWAKFYNNIKHPKRVNVVPLGVNVIYYSMVAPNPTIVLSRSQAHDDDQEIKTIDMRMHALMKENV